MSIMFDELHLYFIHPRNENQGVQLHGIGECHVQIQLIWFGKVIKADKSEEFVTISPFSKVLHIILYLGSVCCSFCYFLLIIFTVSIFFFPFISLLLSFLSKSSNVHPTKWFIIHCKPCTSHWYLFLHIFRFTQLIRFLNFWTWETAGGKQKAQKQMLHLHGE